MNIWEFYSINYMLIKVKVFPNSKKESIVRKSSDSFEIRVKEKAQRGQANNAVIRSLASYFKISPQRIRIRKGSKQRNKIFELL